MGLLQHLSNTAQIKGGSTRLQGKRNDPVAYPSKIPEKIDQVYRLDDTID